MKNLTITAVMLFTLLGTSAAHGQQVPFKHIVIIIQENRTPDSLFGAAPASGTICGSEHDPFESGVDIDNGGPSNFPGTPPMGVCSTELVDGPGNNNAWNEGGGDHTHYPDWASQCDYVSTTGCKMDGACYSTSSPPCGSGNSPEYPPYTFMDPSLISQYFDIAENLGGFANYMFQTNQGPSFIAHQFLFSGSSAPTYPGDTNGFYQYFVSENSTSNTVVGCDVTPSTFPDWADHSPKTLRIRVLLILIWARPMNATPATPSSPTRTPAAISKARAPMALPGHTTRKRWAQSGTPRRRIPRCAMD